MARSKHEQPAHEILREGFAVSCWTYQGFVVVSARAHRARQLEDEMLPAVPSRSRIVVWGDGSGQIRDQLRRRTPRARLRAWLRGVPFPSPEAQLEALADELLAAVVDAPGGGAWAERGGASSVPHAPIRLPGDHVTKVEGAPRSSR